MPLLPMLIFIPKFSTSSLQWHRGTENGGCREFIRCSLCCSFLLTLLPCSSVGSLPQETVPPWLLQYGFFPQAAVLPELPCRSFPGVQTFRGRLLHCGSPTGSQQTCCSMGSLSPGVHRFIRATEFIQNPMSTQFFIAIFTQLPYSTHSTRYFHSKTQQFNFKIQINGQVIELLEHCLNIFYDNISFVLKLFPWDKAQILFYNVFHICKSSLTLQALSFIV